MGTCMALYGSKVQISLNIQRWPGRGRGTEDGEALWDEIGLLKRGDPTMDGLEGKIMENPMKITFPEKISLKNGGRQCPVKDVFFKGRGSFFKEPVLAGTPVLWHSGGPDL